MPPEVSDGNCLFQRKELRATEREQRRREKNRASQSSCFVTHRNRAVGAKARGKQKSAGVTILRQQENVCSCQHGDASCISFVAERW
jgi:hypothetical protein